MNRRRFLRTSGTLLTTSCLAPLAAPRPRPAAAAAPDTQPYPLADLHVHCSENLSMTDIVGICDSLHMQIGVVNNIAPWGITNDEQLQAYYQSVRSYPVFVGLQPMSPGWTTGLSPDLVAQADYIIMDPQIVERGNGYGETIHVWEYTAYIDDAEAFMCRNMDHYLDILTGDEPLDVLACPLFLPACIQREYHTLWTPRRIRQVIDAAQAKGVAIEINDIAHVPHEEFILLAKKAGLKFTFGSDARDHTVGRLDYCNRMARTCRLTERDFFIPKRKA